MTFRSIRIRAAVLATLAAVLVLALAPTSSHAATTSATMCSRSLFCVPSTTYAPANYTGWVHFTEFTQCADPYRNCGSGYVPLTASVQGWRWTGRSWQSASMSTSGRVYITPYASGWTWAWTSSTGWLALGAGGYRFAL